MLPKCVPWFWTSIRRGPGKVVDETSIVGMFQRSRQVFHAV